jgi:hypothetical protein
MSVRDPSRDADCRLIERLTDRQDAKKSYSYAYEYVYGAIHQVTTWLRRMPALQLCGDIWIDAGGLR